MNNIGISRPILKTLLSPIEGINTDQLLSRSWIDAIEHLEATHKLGFNLLIAIKHLWLCHHEAPIHDLIFARFHLLRCKPQSIPLQNAISAAIVQTDALVTHYIKYANTIL